MRSKAIKFTNYIIGVTCNRIRSQNDLNLVFHYGNLEPRPMKRSALHISQPVADTTYSFNVHKLIQGGRYHDPSVIFLICLTWFANCNSASINTPDLFVLKLHRFHMEIRMCAINQVPTTFSK